jgi:hypothetical protein
MTLTKRVFFIVWVSNQLFRKLLLSCQSKICKNILINYKYSNSLQLIASLETLISFGYKLINESYNTSYVIAVSNDSFDSHIIFFYGVICENLYARMNFMKTRNSMGRGGVVPWHFSAGELFSLSFFPHCKLDIFAKIDRSHSKFLWVLFHVTGRNKLWNSKKVRLRPFFYPIGI